MISLGRNAPKNNDPNVTNKKIKKVTWDRCWSISIMNLDQLIFTWKGRYLVLALFAGNMLMIFLFQNSV